MGAPKSPFQTRLFYSCARKDAGLRDDMKTSLALLEQKGVLVSWSDEKVLPGQNRSEKTRAAMDDADIFAFLFSPDFIASESCKKEWDYAKSLSEKGKFLFRVPIIVRDCAWRDFLGEDDVKVLPDDERPISRYENPDEAWTQVYEGIKRIVEETRSALPLKHVGTYHGERETSSDKARKGAEPWQHYVPRFWLNNFAARKDVVLTIDHRHGDRVQRHSGGDAIREYAPIGFREESTRKIFRVRGLFNDEIARRFG